MSYLVPFAVVDRASIADKLLKQIAEYNLENNLEEQFYKDMAEDPDEKCGYIHEQSVCDDHSRLKQLLVIAKKVDKAADKQCTYCAAIAPNMLINTRIV